MMVVLSFGHRNNNKRSRIRDFAIYVVQVRLIKSTKNTYQASFVPLSSKCEMKELHCPKKKPKLLQVALMIVLRGFSRSTNGILISMEILNID